jgi:hypothetical protein
MHNNYNCLLQEFKNVGLTENTQAKEANPALIPRKSVSRKIRVGGSFFILDRATLFATLQQLISDLLKYPIIKLSRGARCVWEPPLPRIGGASFLRQ